MSVSPGLDIRGPEVGSAGHAPGHDEHPPRRARTRTIILIGFGALGFLLILLAVGAVPRLRNRRALVRATQAAQSAVPELAVIRPEPASDAGLSIAATTQAIQDSIIYARISGYLRKRYVDIGDRVTMGQLLAEIDSPETDQLLLQAKADLLQSKKNLDLQRANLHLARTTMGRYRAADAEGAVAKVAVDQSVATNSTAQAAVAAAEAYVKSNQANVERLQALTSFERVLAPFNGTVLQRNVDVGALISAGSPTNNIAVAPNSVSGAASGLFEVAQIDTLRVFVNVPQAYAANVKVGLPAQVTVRGQLIQPMTGTVTRTAGGLDPGTRTLLTEVDIPNDSHRLLPGMFVYVTFQIAPGGTRWRVPATALIFDAKGTRVMIVGAGNKLQYQPVAVGRDYGTSIGIDSGLQGNEAIVKQPTVSLQEGRVVKPIESKNASGS